MLRMRKEVTGSALQEDVFYMRGKTVTGPALASHGGAVPKATGSRVTGCFASVVFVRRVAK